MLTLLNSLTKLLKVLKHTNLTVKCAQYTNTSLTVLKHTNITVKCDHTPTGLLTMSTYKKFYISECFEALVSFVWTPPIKERYLLWPWRIHHVASAQQ